MQSGTTTINDLPNANNQLNNINLNIQNDNNQMQNVVNLQSQVIPEKSIQQQSNIEIQQMNKENYNEMISQLQQASSKGATGLPSRDIPMDPAQVKNDVHVKPNYIEQPVNVPRDYINNNITENDIMNKYNQQNVNNSRLEYLYNELQIPALIATLYFIFQMPFVSKNLFKLFPILFNKDGNTSSQGNLLISILFGLSFYIFNYLVNYLSINI